MNLFHKPFFSIYIFEPILNTMDNLPFRIPIFRNSIKIFCNYLAKKSY